jgi:hypothetical protein
MAYESLSIRRRAFLLGGVGTLLLPEFGRAFAQAGGTPDLGPAVTPEMFGATGNGGDDTAGLRKMVAAVNKAGRGHIVFTPGKTYLLGHQQQLTLHFQNLGGLLIEGGGATLKTADRGCPTASLGLNWGQINIDNCRNVRILGLTFDGNRDRQTHTKGAANGVGFNAGLNFATATFPHSTSDVEIRGCIFRDHGTMTASTDIRGDGIYAVSGVKRLRIEECRFERVGRWAFALAEGATGSEHVYFLRNKVLNEDRGKAGNRPWGAVDIEDTGLPNKHIYIEDNLFSGTAMVAYGGFSGGPPEDVTCEDTFIRRNIWRVPAGVSGSNSPWSLGPGMPGISTYREYRRLYIEDNQVFWEGVATTAHVGAGSKLRDLYFRRNQFTAGLAKATSEGGIAFAFGGHMEGRIEITDNRFVGLGEAISAGPWYADPTPLPLDLRVERNSFDKCYRAFLASFATSTAPAATSKILFRGNRTTNTRGENGEYLDGGRIGIDFYDLPRHDKVWAHRNVTHR